MTTNKNEREEVRSLRKVRETLVLVIQYENSKIEL